MRFRRGEDIVRVVEVSTLMTPRNLRLLLQLDLPVDQIDFALAFLQRDGLKPLLLRSTTEWRGKYPLLPTQREGTPAVYSKPDARFQGIIVSRFDIPPQPVEWDPILFDVQS